MCHVLDRPVPEETHDEPAGEGGRPVPSGAGAEGGASVPAETRAEGDLSVPAGAWLVAAGFVVVLAALGGRYGFHRDELYFIEAGRHPAWGYPDQPPLVPLLAAGWDALTGHRLWAFRLLPAVTAAAVAPLTAATCARLGGTRRGRIWAAALATGMTVTVAIGHLFSTSTFTMALTVALVLLTLRALDDGGPVRWTAVGLVAGVAMQVQLLPAVVLACGLAALLLVGPRTPLRSPWPWAAALLTALLAAPYLLWQTRHGWPQLEVAANIAAGNSTSSMPRELVVPMQLVMVGLLITPVLLAGIVALVRAPALRNRRWLVLAFGLLLVVVTVTGGKPYYASGLLPALVAAGVPPVRAWAGTRPRRAVAGTLLSGHVAVTALACLPISPPGSAGYRVATAANPDAGETVGWDRVNAQVSAAVAAAGPARPTAILASNYGEAGSLDAFRRHGGAVPAVYSGHNGYGEWGPPPAGTTRVLVVGWFGEDALGDWFGECREVGALDTGVDNDEDGAPLRLCTSPRQPWPVLWDRIQVVG